MQICQNKIILRFWKFIKISRWLGIVPFYESGEENKILSVCKKTYSILLILLYLALISTVATDVINSALPEINNIITTFAFLHMILDIFYMTMLILGSIRKKNTWNKFLWQMKQLQNKFQNVNTQTPLLSCMLRIGLDALFFSGSFYFCLNYGLQQNVYHMLRNILFSSIIFYKLFATGLSQIFIETVATNYEVVKKKLKEDCYHRNLSRIKMDSATRKLHNLQKFYTDIGKSVELFNKIMRWPIFIMIVNDTLGIIIMLNVAMTHVNIDIDFFIQSIFTSLVLLVSQLFFK